jgi:4,5-DOPA dioxygenase extradiol
MWRRIEAGDLQSLLDYRRLAPSGVRAHPQEEHLLPLYVALGAAADHARPARIHAGVDDYVLAMDAFRFQPH